MIGLFSFIVGVNSPPSIEKSPFRIVHFYTCYAFDIDFSLAFFIPASIAFLTFSQLRAYSTVVAVDPIDLKYAITSGAKIGFKVPSFSASCLSVNMAVRYFYISPIAMQLLTNGNSALIWFSIRTGATFSPPAVTISSFILPVIKRFLLASKTPKSPECKYPY